MKVAIIGSGIAGNVAAYKLRGAHDITVFESAPYVGGHTNTVDVVEDGKTLAIDTGFIVFNDRTYPNFISLLEEIGQSYQVSEMSFSVQARQGRLEYNGASINSLFAQRRNLFSPSFHRMIRDILRFNDAAISAAQQSDNAITLGQFLANGGYSTEFSEHYLVPMVAAIWSAEPGAVARMPLSFLVRFFDNHGLLQLKDRPTWHVVSGGSREYVAKLTAGHREQVRLNSAVRAVRRVDDAVEISSDDVGTEKFDAVFVACHSDQALALLQDPTPQEQQVLSAIRYQPNEAVLHTDASLMPRRRRAWAAWNYHIPEGDHSRVSVTYNMNILQRIKTREHYCVTLNSDRKIEPSRVIGRFSYDHPIYSLEAVAAQQRQQDINCDRTFFCGAYWRNGFHEDGVVSALNAVDHFERRLEREELHLRRAS